MIRTSRMATEKRMRYRKKRMISKHFSSRFLLQNTFLATKMRWFGAYRIRCQCCCLLLNFVAQSFLHFVIELLLEEVFKSHKMSHAQRKREVNISRILWIEFSLKRFFSHLFIDLWTVRWQTILKKKKKNSRMWRIRITLTHGMERKKLFQFECGSCVKMKCNFCSKTN